MNLSNNNKDKRLKLGQVDTPLHIAQALLEVLPNKYDFFSDIGAGLGNLSASITTTNGLLIEIDVERFKRLRETVNNNHKVVLTNFLDKTFCLKSHISEEVKTLYLSNPPFSRQRVDYNFDFFEDLNTASNFHQLDIAFFDKVLSSMNTQSSLMFIMSAPFVAFEKYENQRQKFINSFDCFQVIILDDGIYKDTEVQSYAVIAHKSHSKNTSKKIMLEKMNASGIIIEQISISKEEAIKSLCFDYHQQFNIIKSYIGTNYKKLGDLNMSLVRGSRSKQEFEKLLLDSIHTTDLRDSFLFLDTSKSKIIDTNKFNVAKVDDILITRVGKRALVRESLVKEGSQIFTDSVYRISTNSKDESKLIWRSISSEVGKLWRNMHAQGKCAKYLTRQAILSLPIS